MSSSIVTPLYNNDCGVIFYKSEHLAYILLKCIIRKRALHFIGRNESCVLQSVQIIITTFYFMNMNIQTLCLNRFCKNKAYNVFNYTQIAYCSLKPFNDILCFCLQILETRLIKLNSW